MEIPMRGAVLAMASAGLVVALSAAALAQSTSPAPQDDAPAVVHEPLGVTRPNAFEDDRLELWRTTLEPGAAMGPTRFSGSWLLRVESGALTVAALDGDAWIQGFAGSESDPIGGEFPRTLGPGQLLSFGPDAILTWANRGAEPAVILATAIVDEDVESRVAVDPDARPEPTPRTAVQRRIVLTGPGMTGDRYRITVADRSGRVVSARVPDERELRFAAGWLQLDHRDIGIGPSRSVGRRTSELLVRWGGTPCGPVVTVDVAPDLAAIDVIDRTPGCDAAGVRYALVLRIRGTVLEPEDIAGRWLRGRR